MEAFSFMSNKLKVHQSVHTMTDFCVDVANPRPLDRPLLFIHMPFSISSSRLFAFSACQRLSLGLLFALSAFTSRPRLPILRF